MNARDKTNAHFFECTEVMFRANGSSRPTQGLNRQQATGNRLHERLISIECLFKVFQCTLLTRRLIDQFECDYCRLFTECVLRPLSPSLVTAGVLS